jgi:hypothetical protein
MVHLRAFALLKCSEFAERLAFFVAETRYGSRARLLLQRRPSLSAVGRDTLGRILMDRCTVGFA